MGLSGGQKVKVVLGAAMWMQPHLVILDEPTNYLDRESLGALADAIREFEGGVVIISHNNDFTTALCPETWVVEKDEDEIPRPNCRGDPEWMKNALATKRRPAGHHGGDRRLRQRHRNKSEEDAHEEGDQEDDEGDQGEDQEWCGVGRRRGGLRRGARALEVDYLYGVPPP